MSNNRTVASDSAATGEPKGLNCDRKEQENATGWRFNLSISYVYGEEHGKTDSKSTFRTGESNSAS